MKIKLITAVALLHFLFSCGGGSTSNLSQAESTDSVWNQKSSTDSDVKPALPENWQYEEKVDKMEGTKEFYAYATSKNKLEMQFPYDGGVSGYLFVRNMGKGNEILLKLEKGQFLSDYVNGTYLKFKFDDGPATKVLCGSPSDPSIPAMFVENPKPILAKLKKAKKLMIEAEYYNEGRQVFEFDVEGLKWSH